MDHRLSDMEPLMSPPMSFGADEVTRFYIESEPGTASMPQGYHTSAGLTDLLVAAGYQPLGMIIPQNPLFLDDLPIGNGAGMAIYQSNEGAVLLVGPNVFSGPSHHSRRSENYELRVRGPTEQLETMLDSSGMQYSKA
jgi:hypothetical protein